MMDFSVVIAVYNGAKTLRATLESLRQQTFKNFEIILVDDESSDNSAEVIEKFSQEYPQICIQTIRQKNKGLGGARNTGMRLSKGQFIALLDQDDIWASNKLERVLHVYRNHPQVSFVTHSLVRKVNGKIGEVLKCDFMERETFQKLLFRGNYFCGSAMSFKKEVISQIGYFSEDRNLFHLSEDYDYWLRAAARGLKFYILDEILGEYVVHTTNFSGNRSLMYQKEWNVVRKHYRERPVRHWSDPMHITKRLCKILARKALVNLHLV